MYLVTPLVAVYGKESNTVLIVLTICKLQPAFPHDACVDSFYSVSEAEVKATLTSNWAVWP